MQLGRKKRRDVFNPIRVKALKQEPNTRLEFSIEDDFVIIFIERSGIKSKIKNVLNTVDQKSRSSISKASEKIKRFVDDVEIPQALWQPVEDAYKQMSLLNNEVGVSVAFQLESNTLGTSCFSRIQRNFVNIQGENSLRQALRETVKGVFDVTPLNYSLRKEMDPLCTDLKIRIKRHFSQD